MTPLDMTNHKWSENAASRSRSRSRGRGWDE